MPIEDAARQQLRNVAPLPFIHHHVAVMPDVHWGMGATVGSVIPTKGAIIPAAVGVDIGCGMMASGPRSRAEHLPDIARRRARGDRARGAASAVRRGRPGRSRGAGTACRPRSTRDVDSGIGRASAGDRRASTRRSTKRAHGAEQLGTLGTGNHFIEVCLDEAARVWVMLHSGSRGVGNRIGTYFIERAKEDMRALAHQPARRGPRLLRRGHRSTSTTTCEAVGWAQDFARTNRELMMARGARSVAARAPAAVPARRTTP